MGFEIAEQLGWRMPDVIIYPTGGGVGLIGIHKALHRAASSSAGSTATLPRLVAVQSTGCAPIVRAFEAGAAESQPWVDAQHRRVRHHRARRRSATSSCSRARGDRAVRRSRSSDADLLADLRLAGRLEGHVPVPGGRRHRHGGPPAARRRGWIGADDEVVLLNTGAGVLYPETVPERGSDRTSRRRLHPPPAHRTMRWRTR